jgi:hypothetical protein
MSESFYKLLKPFIWPRYYEEGPPRYIDIAFLSKDFIDNDGKIREPVRSILDLIVMGYRPVTSLSVLAVLVENNNKPMYGSQIGGVLEKRFQLPKGWFTRTRYYDTRIGKLLKILQRQSILEELRIKDPRVNKEYIGYKIAESLYPTAKDRVVAFLNGESLSIFSPAKRDSAPQDTSRAKRICGKCGFLAISSSAKYCERCGTLLKVNCSACGSEISLDYSFCLNCGHRIN